MSSLANVTAMRASDAYTVFEFKGRAYAALCQSCSGLYQQELLDRSAPRLEATAGVMAIRNGQPRLFAGLRHKRRYVALF